MSHRSARPRSRSGWALTLAILVAPVAAGQGRPPTPVRVDAVRAETLADRRQVTGDLRAERRSLVATREPGVMIERFVKEGTTVAAGDVLARLDARRLDLMLAELDASAAAAAAIRDERQAELDREIRDEELLRVSSERGAANPRELRDAESARLVAAARLRQAEQDHAVITARADLLRVRVADMTITAPFDGVVVDVAAEVGEWVGEGETVVDLLATDHLEAWLDVPQQLLAAARNPDLPIIVAADVAEAVHRTTSRRIVPRVDERARTFRMIVRVPNPGGALAPGMSITGYVPAGPVVEHLTIHPDALLRNDAGTFVYVARSPDAETPPAATPVRVEVLFRTADRAVVRSADLTAGDLVVIEGNERLMPMTPLAPRPAGGPGPAEPAP